MLKTHNYGIEVPESELIDTFPAPEGELLLKYGKIGSGKTYGDTADIIEELKQGRVVYATWPIKVADFDDRNSPLFAIRNFFMFKKRYYWIPCSDNLHFIDAEKGEVDGVPTFDPRKPREYIEYLNTLTHCSLHIDEAWRVIDSYQKTSDFGVEVRSLLLVTRHKFRTITLIAQRPMSIQVTARANVNRFYKYVKIATWPWVRFARYEFQEMTGETVDETQEPESTKTYWAKNSIFNAYDSYYFGGNDPKIRPNFKAYDLNFKERFLLLVHRFSTLLHFDFLKKKQ